MEDLLEIKNRSCLNKITGIISPPSKEILFNPNLKTNDGLLTNHISKSEGISNVEVEIWSLIMYLINQKLKKIRTFRIENVGLLSLKREIYYFYKTLLQITI